MHVRHVTTRLLSLLEPGRTAQHCTFERQACCLNPCAWLPHVIGSVDGASVDA